MNDRPEDTTPAGRDPDGRRRCTRCGARLPGDDPDGHCPQCLLLLAMDDGQETLARDGDEDPFSGDDSLLGPGSRPGGSASTPLPRHIGPYRVLEQIGEGGMGVVYLAEQDQPIRRRVAVKVIKLGMDTEQVIARFEGERQALALMSHPNVARVLDAGTTDRGRPYFVMEHVDGIPITDYCDRHRLPLRRRLILFQQACEAIQHAHQKGIVHRDVKPTNVLVATHGDRAVVKVIDFGIAKAIDQRLTERTVFTQHGMLLGTPEFMSPEQAAGDGAAVDTRTDVYALGVLLYLLVAGVLPFDVQELRQAAFDEIRRRIREVDPPRPSTRLSSLGDASTGAARARATDPGTLVRALRGDLDWIVMKALEKEPDRRYGSPSDLAADVSRHLDHREVHARPPSAAYRARKLVRRHRVAVTAAVLVLVALLAGAAVATWQAVRATRAEAVALREAETARQVSEFVLGLFEVSDPAVARGEDLTARQILEQGRRRIEADLADQPEVQERMMLVIGDIYRELGLFDEARPLLERSLESRRRRLGDGAPEVAEALHRLGRLQGDAADHPASEATLRESRDLYAATLGPGSAEWAAVSDDLAHAIRNQGRLDEALEMETGALAVREAVFGPGSPEVAASLASLATIHYQQSDYAGAEDLFRRALAIREEALGPDHPAVAQTLDRLGSTLGQLGRHDEHEPIQLRALEIYRKVYGDEHSTVAEGLNSLGGLRGRQGRLAEAEVAFREAMAIQEAIFGPESQRVSINCKNLARILLLQGRYGEAEELVRRSLRLDLATFGRDNFWVAVDHRVLSEILRRQARHADAEEHAREALDVLERTVGLEHFEAGQVRKSLARILAARGRPAEAEEQARQALEVVSATTGPDSPGASETLETLGEVLLAAGRRQEAREVLERARMIDEGAMGPDHPTLALTLRLLAEIERREGNREEAERLCRRALEISARAHGEDHLDVAAAEDALARLVAEAGDADAAHRLYAHALEVRRAKLGEAHPDTAATAAALARLVGRRS